MREAVPTQNASASRRNRPFSGIDDLEVPDKWDKRRDPDPKQSENRSDARQIVE